MILVTHLPVFLMVASVFTLILIQLTSVQVASSMLWVIRVLAHMTQVCSIAHMFLFRWFVQLILTASSQRLASRPVMVWSPIHSFNWTELATSTLTRTTTIVALRLLTLCNLNNRRVVLERGTSVPLFYFDK